MAGGALRRGIVVATTLVAGVGLPASAAVATDGHGDRGHCCHHRGGHRPEHGRSEHGWPWHWPDRVGGAQAQPVPKRPVSRPAPKPATQQAAPRRIPRSVPAPVAPTVAGPSGPAPRTPGVAETLAVGAAMVPAAATRSWPTLVLPAVAGAVILGLIAGGFATRRGLSKVD
jgi:hypothetical protein